MAAVIDSRGKPLIIAHRGSAGSDVENTREAFRRAIAEGADMIELDVRLSADGIPLVFHDATLERLAGLPVHIAEARAEDLERVRLRGGRVIPRLERVLEEFAPTIRFDLELKDEAAVTAVVAMIRRHGWLDRIVLTSFQDSALLEARRLCLEIQTGLILGRRTLNPWVRFREACPLPFLWRCGADFAVMHASLVHRLMVPWLHASGRRIYLWIGLTEESSSVRYDYFERGLADGADGIATIWPAELGRYLDSKPP